MIHQLHAPAKQSGTPAPCAAAPPLGCWGTKRIKESLRDLLFLPSNPLRLRSHPACSASAHRFGELNLTHKSHRNSLSQEQLEDFHLNSEPRHGVARCLADGGEQSISCTFGIVPFESNTDRPHSGFCVINSHVIAGRPI